MSIQQLKDWKTWWDGLRTAALKAGATSITTNLAVLASTNTVSNMGIPGFTHVGEGIKTFLVGLLAQFALHTVYAIAQYVQANPDAATITQEVNTAMFTKDPKGNVTQQTSSTTTIVEPPKTP